MGWHFLLQGIFLTQRLNPCVLRLLCWQTDSLPLAPSGKPLSWDNSDRRSTLSLELFGRISGNWHLSYPWPVPLTGQYFQGSTPKETTCIWIFVSRSASEGTQRSHLMWEKKQRKLGREKDWILREGRGSCVLQALVPSLGALPCISHP